MNDFVTMDNFRLGIKRPNFAGGLVLSVSYLLTRIVNSYILIGFFYCVLFYRG